jgi:hypothetical protein
LRSYLGLLVQGKSDFDTIENFRDDALYNGQSRARRVVD